MSGERNWTPGPWSVSNGQLLRVTTTKRRPLVVCGVHRIGKNGGPSDGDPVANARLIATSPELYDAAFEACIDMKIAAENALDAAKTDPRWEGVYDKLMVRVSNLEAALAKARGESNG